MSRFVCTIPEAGELLGLNKHAAYQAAKLGRIDTILIGKVRMKVLVSTLANQLGVSLEAVGNELDRLRKEKNND